MNKIQALALVLAMSISGGVLAAGGGVSSGWGAAVNPSVVAPVTGTPGANAGFILFMGGAVATVVSTAKVTSTPNH